MRKAFTGQAVALAILLASSVAGCADGGSGTRRGFGAAPEGGFEDKLVLEGTVEFPPSFTVAGGPLAVDPVLRVAYTAGGMGQNEMARIDVSDPANMTVTAFAPGFGGGVAVDPATHHVATTDGGVGGFGDLGIFEPNGATNNVLPISPTFTCGGDLANDEASGHFGVSTQCPPDMFSIYDQTSRSIILQTPIGGVASSVVFNAATGIWYENRHKGRTSAATLTALVITPLGNGSFSTADFPIDGRVQAADPVRNTLWFADVHGRLAQPANGLFLLDGTTHAVIGPTAVTVPSAPAIATGIDRAYSVSGQDGLLRLLDAETGVELDSFDVFAEAGFSAALGGLATDGERAYLVVIHPSGTPRWLYAFGRRRRG